jgi:acyl-CoA hydrolase
VKIRACLTVAPRAVLEADPDGETFHWVNLHFSAYDRKKHDAGRSTYLPVNLGEIPDYYRRFIDPVDIVILKARPMDAEGNFNLSMATTWLRAVTERARMVIIEETTGLPHVMGDGVSIHRSEVDFVIKGDDAPVPELPNPPATDVDRAVARLITAEIEDGSCLQIGIGGMPNAVCGLLCESTIEDLGVHTEMMTDGIIDLYRAGRITGARKTLDPGRMVCTFALGSRSLYETLDHNPDVAFRPVEYTNLPHMIMQNDRVASINNTTQIDLTGQAASESDGHRHLTGTGGQAQFIRGAYASKGGFYSYAYPAPDGFSKESVAPSEAFFDEKAGEFILPYDVVRNASDPEDALLGFLESTYDAAARLADWDRASLDCPRGQIGVPRPI